MSIVSQIERIRKNIADAFAKAIEKGATSPSEQISDNLASCIESISTSSGGGSSITKGIIINAIDEEKANKTDLNDYLLIKNILLEVQFISFGH